jgi:hypothetical protein
MKRVLWPLLMLLALGAIAVAGYWSQRPASAQAIACADVLAGCGFSHGGTPVRLRFSAPPRPLQAFALSVTAPGARRVSAEFHMSGMEMGFNRYDLQSTAAGAFAARIVLPVCVSGQASWTLILDIDGTRYVTPFVTR